MRAIAAAASDIASALHDLISGHLFFRRSASHKHSQWQAVPAAQPEVASAKCTQSICFNSLGYPLGIDGVGDDMLAAYEREAGAYREQMSRFGLVPAAVLERDLAPVAYLAAVAVPQLVSEIRKLRGELNE